MLKKTGKKIKKGHKPSTSIVSMNPFAIPKELWRLSSGWVKHATFGIPISMAQGIIQDSSMIPWGDGRVYKIVGEALLKVIDAWGPLYGKAMQIWLSRLGQDGSKFVEMMNLDRIYGDWPALHWSSVQKILDREIPAWRDELDISPHPLGVASLSQVHAAKDKNGGHWVIKVLKPNAVVRLRESIAAIETAVLIAEPFAISRIARRFLSDVRDLCNGLRRETNFDFERKTMDKVQDLIQSKRQKSIRVPLTHPTLASSQVIVMERLFGVKISDIVSGQVQIEDKLRKNLARKLLSELLIQIFEWGLFHADPHAGNLMLLDDGTVGLYDWGLAGELFESDRKFIAAILKSVLAMDIERLIDVLADMGLQSQGRMIERDKIRSELNQLIKMIETSKASSGEPPSLHQLVNAALEGADKLGIAVPNGLLLMAKSIITIEGLAKGIDADVPFARVAGPVLFRASDPEFSDVIAIAKKLPLMIGRYFKRD